MNKTIKSKQIVDVLELPKDIVNGIPYLNFEGNVELTIDNHKGIMKYNEEEINIQTKHFLEQEGDSNGRQNKTILFLWKGSGSVFIL